MRAFALTGFGSEPVVIDVPVPQPGRDEVLVQVRTASVNGFDLSVASGRLEGMMEHRFPVVLGKDFAGTVAAVGADVTGFTVGDRVFGVVTKSFLGDGSLGEFVAVPAAVGIAHLPEGVSFEQGGALGLAGTAAVDAFDAARVAAGSRVLIVGATGGVGLQALQLAVQAGAEVIATASSTEEIELVKQLGAAHTIDYKGDVAGPAMQVYPDGVDVVLHFAGDPQPLLPVVKRGGSFVSTVLQSAEDVSADGVHVFSVYANPVPATLERLARNQAGQHSAVTIQRVYQLEEAGDAFRDFAGGTLGKLVIAMNS